MEQQWLVLIIGVFLLSGAGEAQTCNACFSPGTTNGVVHTVCYVMDTDAVWGDEAEAKCRDQGLEPSKIFPGRFNEAHDICADHADLSCLIGLQKKSGSWTWLSSAGLDGVDMNADIGVEDYWREGEPNGNGPCGHIFYKPSTQDKGRFVDDIECRINDRPDKKGQGTLCMKVGECHNGGTIGSSTTCACSCPSPWTGDTCETCSRTCYNGGTRISSSCTCNCAGNWSGTTCTTCSLSCQNGGAKVSSSCTCNCAGNWEGNTCTSCGISGCQNGGTFSSGSCSCSCPTPWTGNVCQTCSRTCDNGGTLNTSTCTCGGCSGLWEGDACDQCSISGCQNGGTFSSGSCSCSCPTPWTGNVCQTCSRTCDNGGTLDSSSCTCSCPGDWEGSTCQTCGISGCQNGGTFSSGSCSCSCPTPWTGNVCQTCPRTCDNGGTLDSSSCTCSCPGDWEGSTCQTCGISGCQNGGTFSSGSCSCSCPTPWTGNVCQTCSRTCDNGGTLDSSSCTCSCPGDWEGSTCQTCGISGCQNGGTFSSGSCSCSCPTPWTGNVCQTCSRTCDNGGTLTLSSCTCTCAGDWEGDTCAQCGISTCQHGGTLNSGSCTCSCVHPWVGNVCQTCSRTCENGGTLTLSTCTCTCTNHWKGDTCGQCDISCQNGGTMGSCLCACTNYWSGIECESCTLDCGDGLRWPEPLGLSPDGNQECKCACPAPYTNGVCNQVTPDARYTIADYRFSVQVWEQQDSSPWGHHAAVKNHLEMERGYDDGAIVLDILNPRPDVDPAIYVPSIYDTAANSSYVDLPVLYFGGSLTFMFEFQAENKTGQYVQGPSNMTLIHLFDWGFTSDSNNGTSHGIRVDLTSSMGVRVGLQKDNETMEYVNVHENGFNFGFWYHLTVVFDSADGSVAVYKNGTSIGSGQLGPVPFHYSRTGYIGWAGNHTTEFDNFWPGELERVTLIGRAMSSSEVLTWSNERNLPSPGDGSRRPNEECDDENSLNGDGCTYPGGKIEDGWQCAGVPSVCIKVTSISPSSVLSGTASSITLSGYGFGTSASDRTVSSMYFGTNPVSNIHWVDSQTLTATAGPIAAETAELWEGLKLEIGGNSYNFSSMSIEHRPPPRLYSISPANWDSGQAIIATLHGEYFGYQETDSGRSSGFTNDTHIVECSQLQWESSSSMVCSIPGGIIGGGSFMGWVNTTLGSVTNASATIELKPRATQAPAWDASFSSTGFESPKTGNVIPAHDAFLISGETTGEGLAKHYGGLDVFVWRIDINDGHVIWKKYLGSASDDHITASAVANPWGELPVVCVCGYTEGPFPKTERELNGDDPFTFSQTASEKSDIFVACLDATVGAFLWGVQDGTAGSDRAEAMTIIDNRVYIAGTTTGGTWASSTWTDKTHPSFFLVHYDVNTQESEFHAQSGGLATSLEVVGVTFKSDKVYIVGNCNNVIRKKDFLSRPPVVYGGFTDGFVAMVDVSSLSVLEWTSQVGQPSDERYRGVHADSTTIYTPVNFEGAAGLGDGLGMGTFGLDGNSLVLHTSWVVLLGKGAIVTDISGDDTGLYMLGHTNSSLVTPNSVCPSGLSGLQDVFLLKIGVGQRDPAWCHVIGSAGANTTALTLTINSDSLFIAYREQTSSGLDTRKVSSVPLNKVGTRAITHNTSLPCDAGYFADLPGYVACMPCSSGYYQTNSSATGCDACKPGTYAGSPGHESCIACPRGYYSLGTVADKASTKCDACALGTFAASTGSSSCTLCPAGTANKATLGAISANSCVACEKGTVSASTGSSKCNPCSPGHYAPNQGLTACLKCPAGSYQSLTGAAECVSCPAGTYHAGTGKTSVSDCIPCPAGTASPGLRQQCVACTAGNFADGNATRGNVVCEPCPAGSYGAADGAKSCALCPQGLSQALTGQTSCDNCAVGEYQDELGGVSCKQCPHGSSTPSEQTTNLHDCHCPPGTFGQPHTTPAYACTYCGNPRDVTCGWGDDRPKPKPGVWMEQPRRKDQPNSKIPFVSLSVQGPSNTRADVLETVVEVSTPAVYRCSPSTACPTDSMESCGTGYDGTGCVECAEGYVRVKGECIECLGDTDANVLPNEAYLAMIGAVGVLVVIFAVYSSCCHNVLVAICCAKRLERKNAGLDIDQEEAEGGDAAEEVADIAEGTLSEADSEDDFHGQHEQFSDTDVVMVPKSGVLGEGRPSDLVESENIAAEHAPKRRRTLQERLRACVLKGTGMIVPVFVMIIKYLQLTSLVMSIDASLPGQISFIDGLSSVTVFNFDMLIEPMTCSSTAALSFVAKYYMRLSIIIGYILLLLTHAAMFALTMTLQNWRCGISLTKIARLNWARTGQYLVVSTTLVLVPVASTAIEPFVCYPRSDSAYHMVADPAIQCFTMSDSQWKALLPGSIMGIVFAFVFIQVTVGTLLCLLWRHRHKPLYRNVYGPLYAPYREGAAYAWVLIDNTFNLGLMVVGVLSIASAREQATTMFAVLFAQTTVQTYFSPYSVTAINRGQLYSQASLLLVLGLGLISDSGESSILYDLLGYSYPAVFSAVILQYLRRLVPEEASTAYPKIKKVLPLVKIAVSKGLPLTLNGLKIGTDGIKKVPRALMGAKKARRLSASSAGENENTHVPRSPTG